MLEGTKADAGYPPRNTANASAHYASPLNYLIDLDPTLTQKLELVLNKAALAEELTWVEVNVVMDIVEEALNDDPR